MYVGNQYDALDFLNLMSFLLGYENLQENRQQSRHNDVQAANDKQAKFLLEELTKQFEQQNMLLQKILDILERKD